MNVYQVIVRDNHNGKKFVYNISSSDSSMVTHLAKEEHKKATGSSGEVEKITKLG